MTTKSSLLIRSKRAETRVAKYLWGAYVSRDWKEDHDVSGPDADGRTWIGEVKSHAWPSGPGGLQSLLLSALAQAEKHSELAFAVLIPPNCEPKDALCIRRSRGMPVVITLEAFKAYTIEMKSVDDHATFGCCKGSE